MPTCNGVLTNDHRAHLIEQRASSGAYQNASEFRKLAPKKQVIDVLRSLDDGMDLERQ
jgi:hypothetical protein